MSAPAGSGETAVFVPDAKPVHRFVAAIAVVALALAALWWSGAFAPRLIATCRERTGIGTDADTVRFELANAGPLPVRILGLDGPDETIERSRVRIDQRVVPGEGVQLAGGGKAALEVGLDPHLEPDRPLDSPETPPAWVRAAARGDALVVRTVAGREQSVWFGSILSERSECPPLEQSRS